MNMTSMVVETHTQQYANVKMTYLLILNSFSISSSNSSSIFAIVTKFVADNKLRFPHADVAQMYAHCEDALREHQAYNWVGGMSRRR